MSSRFRGTWRRYQEGCLAAFEADHAAGRDKTLLVAPPGSGKTLVGLEIVHRIGHARARAVPDADDPGAVARAAGAVRRASDDIHLLTYQSLCQADDPDGMLREAASRHWITSARQRPADGGSDRGRGRGGPARRPGAGRARSLPGRAVQARRPRASCPTCRPMALSPHARRRLRLVADGSAWSCSTSAITWCHCGARCCGRCSRRCRRPRRRPHRDEPRRADRGRGRRCTWSCWAMSTSSSPHRRSYARTPGAVPGAGAAVRAARVGARLAGRAPRAARAAAGRARHARPARPVGVAPRPAARAPRRRVRSCRGRSSPARPRLAESGLRWLHARGEPPPAGAPRGERFRAPLGIDDWVALLDDYAQRCLRAPTTGAESRPAARRATGGPGRPGLRAHARGHPPYRRRSRPGAAQLGAKPIAMCEALACEMEARGDALRAAVLVDTERGPRQPRARPLR